MQNEQEIPQIENRKFTEKQIKLFTILGGILTSFIIAFSLAFNPIWQLVLLAGIAGGAFFTKPKQAALYCALGTGFGWLLYIVIQIAASNVEVVLAQVTGIIFGQEYFSIGIMFLLILLGAVFGLLGGILSSSIRKLILIKKYESVRDL